MRREYTQITNLEMENSKLKDEITFLINQLNITKEQLSKVMQELTHIHIQLRTLLIIWNWVY